MKKSKFLTAAVSGLLLASCGSTSDSGTTVTDTAMGECHGINACKGTGECGGAGHGCGGKNACKGQGWVKMSKDDCESKGGKFKN